MKSSVFVFEKSKVIQALRHHFVSRREVRILIIMVNVFAVLSALLYYFQKVSPLAFLLSSTLWVLLMIVFWFIMPLLVYKKTRMFRESFQAEMNETCLTLIHANGSQGWNWEKFETWAESPFFIYLYFNARTFFLLPKNAFSEQGLEELRKCCREKIGARS